MTFNEGQCYYGVINVFLSVILGEVYREVCYGSMKKVECGMSCFSLLLSTIMLNNV